MKERHGVTIVGRSLLRSRRYGATGLLAASLVAGAAGVALSQEPSPDPAGTATGNKASVVDAGGTPFVPLEPTDEKSPTYAADKKAFDEFQSQAAKEPLAVKLADSVGHVRIAANFSWTLLTGYLVLFMQAGFALLTCGLVRRRTPGT